MKAVDNLNDFVRSHMLEPFDTRAHIDSLVEHFENLTQAHEAVVRARDQLELLEPMMVADSTPTTSCGATVSSKSAASRRPCRYYFADRTRSLYGRRIEELAAPSSERDRHRTGSAELRHERAAHRGEPVSTSRSPATAAIGWRPSRRDRASPAGETPPEGEARAIQPVVGGGRRRQDRQCRAVRRRQGAGGGPTEPRLNESKRSVQNRLTTNVSTNAESTRTPRRSTPNCAASNPAPRICPAAASSCGRGCAPTLTSTPTSSLSRAS